MTLSKAIPSMKAAALIKAAEVFGGLDTLSTYLGVPVDDLRKWIAGDGEPSYATFMLAVDAILEN